MGLLKFSIKNVLENKRRSIILGGYILMVTFFLIMFDSFIVTVKEDVNRTIRLSLTGDIQIRPGRTVEKDMFELSAAQNVLPFLSTKEVHDIEDILTYQVKPDYFVPTLRTYVKVYSSEKGETSRVIGINLADTHYKETLILSKGRYAKNSNEIVLSGDLSKKLKVKLGDSVTLIGKDKTDNMRSIELHVVGIGEVDLLSGFGADPLYIDIKAARSITGAMKDEASDILITQDGITPKEMKAEIVKALVQAGYQEKDFKVTDASQMGGFLNSIMMIYFVMFYFFLVVFIIIIGVMILNIVSLSVIERRQDIGTLRAIGFSKNQVIVILMGELFGITLLGVSVGGIGALALLSYLAHQTFAVIPPLDYLLGVSFTLRMHEAAFLPIILSILVFTFTAGFIPYAKGTRERPVDMLRG